MSMVARVAAAGALLTILAGCSGSGDKSATPTFVSPSAAGGTSPATESTTQESAARQALPAALRHRVPTFTEQAPAPTKVTLPPGPKAPNFARIPTTEKIAFITIDDGWEKNPEALKLFQAANVPVTLFLEVNAIKDNPTFFTPLQGAGATIQDHTITHPNMTHLSYDAQKHEICAGADELKKQYGKRPTLFRPPFGSYNDNTLRAVHDCGLKASFTWMETTDKGIIRFQRPTHLIAPGDIILMHFRPAFIDDFLAVLNIIHKSGLTPARLEDYIP
ncbi:polysaccharide deacetylase [Actinoplanes sp. SE50]|nr:ylxY-like uncharacterized protein [Actinoplanes sp. SE50/110]ATO81712.1 polysaccharide deacetylase [Actinoplanes sp. SE50]SLL99120.1 putative polysaccharide deacetylase [Actinoplanes sp. SE50/110]